MRVVVADEAGVKLDELEVTAASLAQALVLAATRYPRAHLYVDGCEVQLGQPQTELQSEPSCPNEPVAPTAPINLADIQQVANALLWSSYAVSHEAAQSLRAESMRLTEQTLAQNQKLMDAATALREEHRKALKSIGTVEQTRVVLTMDQELKQRRDWRQAQREVRPSMLSEVGRDALQVCIGTLMEGARQFAGGATKGGTDGK